PNLKLLLQLDVQKPPDVIVFESGISVGVAMEEPGLPRWILAKDVVAAERDGAVVQDRLPARHCVGRSALNRLAILARHHFLAALRIAGHRRLLHRWSEDQTVRRLDINEVGRIGPVFVDIVTNAGAILENFSVATDIMPGGVDIEVVPGPVNSRHSFPAIKAVAVKNIGNLADNIAAFRVGRRLEHELIKISPLSQHGEGPELGLDLVLAA